MPSSLLHRRGARVACAVSAAVAAAAVSVPSSALASPQKPSTGLRIVRPYRSIVSGTVVFSARGTASDAGRLVFAIDGRRVWSTNRLFPRYRRATMINTRKLRNGWHVLAIREFFAHRHARVARKAIFVRNHMRAMVTRSAGPLSVGAFGPPAGGMAGASVANLNRETYLYSTTWSLSQEATRYRVIVLAGDEHWLIPELKAINPNVKILLYQSIMHTNRNDYASMQTVTGCTAYADDVANHPSWFLHDQSGNPILAPGTNDRYVMDVGNPAYQQACATNAAALAKQYGFDGIFWDVVMGRLDWAMTHRGMHVPAYPTNMLWQSAMNSALGVLGPALRAQGLLAFGNVSGTPNATVWEQWVSHLDGVEEESWTDGGPGVTQQIPYWSSKFTELSWAQANGKYEIVHSYNSTEAGNTYGLAAMMLSTSGLASYSTSNTNYTSSENWFSEYATAQALGAPAGPYKILANGVYERAFSGGVVLVNPTAYYKPSFSLGGGTYSGSRLTNVRTAQLGPTSGLILLKVG